MGYFKKKLKGYGIPRTPNGASLFIVVICSTGNFHVNLLNPMVLDEKSCTNVIEGLVELIPVRIILCNNACKN